MKAPKYRFYSIPGGTIAQIKSSSTPWEEKKESISVKQSVTLLSKSIKHLLYLPFLM